VPPIIADDPVIYTCVLEARRETADFLARLLHQRRCAIGTRSGTRVLGPFKHAVLALRWFLDNTRVRQLAADNALGISTATTCTRRSTCSPHSPRACTTRCWPRRPPTRPTSTSTAP
jgi:hypothetical protein